MHVCTYQFTDRSNPVLSSNMKRRCKLNPTNRNIATITRTRHTNTTFTAANSWLFTPGSKIESTTAWNIFLFKNLSTKTRHERPQSITARLRRRALGSEPSLGSDVTSFRKLAGVGWGLTLELEFLWGLHPATEIINYHRGVSALYSLRVSGHWHNW